MMMIAGIYQIKNDINGKIYVGKAKNLATRWKQHKDELAKGTHVNQKLQKDYNELGTEAFTFSILEEVPECLNFNDILFQKEREWGERLNALDEQGYNEARFYKKQINYIWLQDSNFNSGTVTYLSAKRIACTKSEEEVVAYIGLKIMLDKTITFKNEMNEKQAIVNFNIANLNYELSGKLEIGRYDKGKLEEGLAKMINDGSVDLIDSDDKGNYVINAIKLALEESKAIAVQQKEIWNIFNIHHKQHFSLLRFAIGLYGTIETNSALKKYKCGICPYRTMPEYTGITRLASCQDYFKLLEEEGVFYVRHKCKIQKCLNEPFKVLTNVYGRPQDSKIVDSFVDNQ